MVPSGSDLDDRQRRLTLFVTCIGQGMILLDNTIVNVALPAMQRELRISPGNLEWTVNAYVLALASLILLGGTLGDRYGRKRLFLVGLAIFTVFSAGCAMSRSDLALIVNRGLQGVGAAILAPLSLAILVDAYPPERRTAAIGIWASVAGLGFGAGPIVGGLLIELSGWPAVFWVNVPLGMVGFVLAAVVVRESRDSGARSLDPVGTVLISLGLFVLTFALIEANVHHWLSTYTLSLGAVAFAALAAFLVHEGRTSHPMVPLGLFRDRIFSAANAVYALAYASLATMFFFVTLYFQNVKGWSALQTGLSWIPLNVPFLAVAPFAGRIVKRTGAVLPVAAGLVLGSVSTFGLALLDAGSSYSAAWPCYLLSGLGYGLLVPAISAAAMAAVPADRSGVGSGILNSARQVGAAVGLAVLGSIAVVTASRAWHASIGSLDAVERAKAAALVQQVAGGEVRIVSAALGQQAAESALASFLSGYRAAMLVASGLLLVAAVIAVAGLRKNDRSPAGE
jgi:MFS transporter, DHA2 family, methylenomycin A resistance protein